MKMFYGGNNGLARRLMAQNRDEHSVEPTLIQVSNFPTQGSGQQNQALARAIMQRPAQQSTNSPMRDFSAGLLPPHLQNAMRADPRYGQAQALQSSSLNTGNVQGGWQAAAKLAQAYVGKSKMDELNSDYQGKGQAYNQALGDLLAGKPMTPDAYSALGPQGVQFRMNEMAQAKKQTNPLSAQEVQMLGLPRGTVAQRSGSGQIGVLYQPDTSVKPLTQAAKAGKDLEAGLIDRTTYDAILAGTGKPSVSIEMGGKGAEELAKLDAQAIADHGEGLMKMRNIMPDLSRLRTAVSNYDTGPGSSARLYVGALANSLGMSVDPNLSEGEVIQSIQSRLAPAMRATGSGSSSDKDVEMFIQGLPNLMRTPEGNMKVIDHLERIMARKQQEQRFMREYYTQNGYSLTGVHDAMDQALGREIFSPEELREMGAQDASATDGLPQYVPGPAVDAPDDGGEMSEEEMMRILQESGRLPGPRQELNQRGVR